MNAIGKAALARIATLAVTAAVVLLTAMAAAPDVALAADSTPCPVGNISCVTVVVSAPGSTPASGPAGGGVGAGAAVDALPAPPPLTPCPAVPAGAPTACNPADEAVWCASLQATYGPSLALADLNLTLAVNGCPPVAPGSPEAALSPSPATLALQAAASFVLSSPTAGLSPGNAVVAGGFVRTWVNVWTWFWTSPSTWKPLTATASAGGNSATVTATPVALAFAPGDGSAPAVCGGPGRAWENSDGLAAPSQGGCGFQYRDVSGPGADHPFTSTQTITWKLTWTGTGNSRGVLTQRTTSTSTQLNVWQIQAVVTR